MNDLLAEFQASFKNEEELRKALFTLISKMPGVTGTQLTHGAQEYGKDIVFYAPDFLGKLQLHACVVKNSKIDGSAKSSGAREVLTQANEAFDTPHIDEEGQTVHVSRVFIISPYNCPPTTMNSIAGALKQRAGQVLFLCGSLLVEEFSKYWQEFLLFNSSALNLYVASVTRSVMGRDPVNFLLRNHQLLTGELESLQNRYVPQGFKKSASNVQCLLERDILTKRSFISAVTHSHARTMAGQMVALALLLRSEIHSDDDEFATHIDLSSKLLADSEALTSAWTQAYDEYKKDVERTGRRALNKADAHVPIGETFFNSVKITLNSSLDAVKSFLSKLDVVNQHLETKKDAVLKVSSATFKTIGEVQDVVRSTPNLFQSAPEPIDLKLNTAEILTSDSLHLLITAPAGYGKTSFCKVNALRDAISLEKQQSDRIPVYVSLHSLATVTITEDAILNRPEIKAVMESGDSATLRWNFYLDGLDEIANEFQRDAVLRVAHEMTQKFPHAKVVMTSRDYIKGKLLYWLTRIDLAELDDAGVIAIIAKWLPEVELSDAFRIQVEQSRTLGKLIRIPLLATLILAVFKKRRALPSNKLALYETFIDLLCGGWDYVKSVNRDSKYGRHEKIAVLARFAGILHLNELRQGTEALLRRAIADVAPLKNANFDALLGEMIEDGLIQRSAGHLIFGHLSFQEFLAARELGDPSGERNNAVLLNFLRGDDWWREVLAFYVAGPNRPEEMERWIRKAAERVEMSGVQCRSRERFLLASIEEACPGWEPKLLKQTLEAVKPKS